MDDSDGLGPTPPAVRRGRAAAAPSTEPIGRMALAGLLGAMATLLLAFGAVFVLIADLQDHIGFPDWGLGAIVGVSFLVSFASQVSLARYADRGHARRLLACGLAAAAIGMVGFAAAASLWQLVAARALMGLGHGMFLPAARRIIVAGSPGREAELLGRLEAAGVAGFIAGPPTAAALAGLLSLRAPFLVLAALVVVSAPTMRGLAEPGAAGGHRRARVTGVLLRNHGVRAGLLIGAGLYTTIGVFDTLWSRFLTDLGASTGFVAVSLLAFGIPMVVAMPAGGRLADRVGPARAGFAALCCGVPLLALYGQTASLVALCAIAVVHATVDAVTTPAGVAAVTRAAPSELTAAAQGLYGATTSVAAGAASVVAAPLYGATTPSWTWATCAGIVLVLVVAGRLDRDAASRRPVGRGRFDRAGVGPGPLGQGPGGRGPCGRRPVGDTGEAAIAGGQAG